ncbi:Bax inhibitor-1/YccA family protein [Algibacter amylolyticus]|uniref:Bax inhibitor-1/YccA family protein n=1 Tax=Algibacter amylolyticus TaxID=1608400 RepID=A0A5M7BL76_9FLAO|nr:Bax inhibitor-1/YccA family protein [Algibacter amylolyticus]KAA5827961.1 Bax inhibitor-1/YccA family protein [Algibacter amylolyticus]MBB5267197.1 putative YccA/Bax inhibitor family protein [Algibacter amylolyticus]TSJ82206.1 Bax inhibitor-1/YccA family protein [Algibacter amylolyticus]
MNIFNKTSNPAFTNYFFGTKNTSGKTMSVSGIFIKSMLSIAIIVIISIGMWKLHSNGQSIKWYSIGGMLAAIVISIVISVRQHWAHVLVPLYAIAKGFFLGAATVYAHAQFPNLPYQAIGITVVTFIVMLLLYQTRIIVVTKKLRSVIITAVTSIFIIYLISWILGFFGIKVFIWGISWPAIIFNILAAVFASLSLLLDFDYIERHKNRSPKYKEWLATWGLLVTLVWLYMEVLRLMRKLAIKF